MIRTGSSPTPLSSNDWRVISSSRFFLLMVLLAILFAPFTSRGQENDNLVKGVITDNEGNALSGVSVHLKGKKTGTTTDEKGGFVLAVAPKSILVITHMNYKRLEIAVG